MNQRIQQTFLLVLLSLIGAACTTVRSERSVSSSARPGVEIATFGAGCFWCAEAAFEQLDGVIEVQSGFMGGEDVDDPTGDALVEAGHAEVVQIWFDPSRIQYKTLLEWFWRVHDPSSLNRQGNDEGPEYRSVIFTHGDRQLCDANDSRHALQQSEWRTIHTIIDQAGRFYPASDKHQDYYQRNRDSEYCQDVIAPHLEGAGLER